VSQPLDAAMIERLIAAAGAQVGLITVTSEMIEQMMATFGARPAPPTAGIGQRDPFYSYDRPASYGVHTETVRVSTRDGSYLMCDVLRPAGPDGAPTVGRFSGLVYEFNAYYVRPLFAVGASYFVERGYVAVVASVPGAGGSPGQVDPFGLQEQLDGYDLVEWLAAQSYSTGRVGQMGVSYGGHSTLLTAIHQPPHLVAAIAVQALSDWYRNTIYRGGIPSARIREWQRTYAPKTLETYPLHPFYDEFWRERSVAAHGDRLTIPVLDVGGWLDQYRDAMVENFVARPESTWMVAGPWEHGMRPGQFEDIAAAGYLAWWDHWLTDYPAPLPQAKVTSYEMPAHGWHQYPAWPPAHAAATAWLPRADGALAAAETPAGAASVALFEANHERLTFETATLADDLVLVGGAEMELHVAFTATDGNLAVVLEDVDVEGNATRVSNGWLKASHRDGHESAAPVVPGKFYDVTVELWPMHHRFVAGHTLRLTVSSDDYPEIDFDAPVGAVSVALGTPATRLTAQVLDRHGRGRRSRR
jgi:predicted acyl esterase